jgi:hypothetical protein
VYADELVGAGRVVRWQDDEQETKNGDSLDSHKPRLPSLVPDSARILLSHGAVNDGDLFVMVRFRKNL